MFLFKAKPGNSFLSVNSQLRFTYFIISIKLGSLFSDLTPTFDREPDFWRKSLKKRGCCSTSISRLATATAFDFSFTFDFYYYMTSTLMFDFCVLVVYINRLSITR